jgi:glutaconate CoA-transferase subunit B
MTNTDVTTHELLACAMARDLEDGLGVPVGANLPVPRAAVLLAHLLHGPNMLVLLSWTRANLINVPELRPFEFITDWRAAQWGESYWAHDDGFLNMRRRANWIFYVGGLQIDQFGNSNLIGVGDDPKHLKFRGPGGVGTGNMAAFTNRYYLYSHNHSPRIFVPKVDYISALGWGDGPGTREKWHIPGGGPRYCYTSLCVMDFEPETKRMRLHTLHPGVTVDQVVKATGFELVIPDDVGETPPPTEQELDVLRRRVDPTGMLRR